MGGRAAHGDTARDAALLGWVRSKGAAHNFSIASSPDGLCPCGCPQLGARLYGVDAHTAPRCHTGGRWLYAAVDMRAGDTVATIPLMRFILSQTTPSTVRAWLARLGGTSLHACAARRLRMMCVCQQPPVNVSQSHTTWLTLFTLVGGCLQHRAAECGAALLLEMLDEASPFSPYWAAMPQPESMNVGYETLPAECVLLPCCCTLYLPGIEVATSTHFCRMTRAGTHHCWRAPPWWSMQPSSS